MSGRSITIFYHYFYPDPVISSRLFTDLACHLRDKGWKVTVYTSNRDRRDTKADYSATASPEGIRVVRLWRPPFLQGAIAGRVINTSLLFLHWILITLSGKARADVVLTGTDPPLSVVLSWLLKLRFPRSKVVHWCFDVYPELAATESLIKEEGIPHRIFRFLAGLGYAKCDAIVDIGKCMRTVLSQYPSKAHRDTIIPWALIEAETIPVADEAERKELFDNARVAVLYSGSLGRGHIADKLIALACSLDKDKVRFAFSVPSNQAKALEISEEHRDRITITGFADEANLLRRLCAADIHVVSLKPSWAGLVIPSKFFGSMAVGRPVIYIGSRKSVLADWIEDYRLGWVIEKEEDEQLLLADLQEIIEYPALLQEYRERAHFFYQNYCRKKIALERWEELLTALTQGTGVSPCTPIDIQ